MNAIELTRVKKRYGRRLAGADLPLRVAACQTYALVGTNGAGKATTNQMPHGSLTPDTGTIQVAGCDDRADPVTAWAPVAYVPETLQLYPALTGIENRDYFSRFCGHRSAQEPRALAAR
jgi:ABC-2 type transport system ATP-binding protein